jgi:hypothetical protein
MDGPPFIPGAALSRRLYEIGVRPLLDRHYPRLVHSAGLIWSGSDVLGFDTERSRDHGWGPRVMLFLREEELRNLGEPIVRMLSNELPDEIDGYPTNFGSTDEPGTLAIRPRDGGPIHHQVVPLEFGAFMREYVGFDDPDHVSILDWLTAPQQRLRTLTNGPVFHDGLAVLRPMQSALRWYPDPIWCVLLAAQWRRIGQEEAFPGRCAEVGDELGSRVVTARLVRDVMRLAFLMERQYPPYSKWFGTGFTRLACSSALGVSLEAALDATAWPEREESLVAAYRIVATMHNELGLTERLPTEPSLFWGRPFRVIHGDRFAGALSRDLDDEMLRTAAQIGSIDTWADSTDVLSYPAMATRARAMYVDAVNATGAQWPARE